MEQRFRFLPRYRGIALTAMGTGGALAGLSLAVGGAALPLVTGGIGILLGTSYLLSPSWRLEVVVDDAALEVRSRSRSRFRLLWGDVVAVMSSPSTDTCFVDGGSPERSLLVPGQGAPAPYDLENKHALCEAIVARVRPERVTTVESLATPRR